MRDMLIDWTASGDECFRDSSTMITPMSSNHRQR